MMTAGTSVTPAVANQRVGGASAGEIVAAIYQDKQEN